MRGDCYRASGWIRPCVQKKPLKTPRTISQSSTPVLCTEGGGWLDVGSLAAPLAQISTFPFPRHPGDNVDGALSSNDPFSTQLLYASLTNEKLIWLVLRTPYSILF
jgi:hypothetical protein